MNNISQEDEDDYWWSQRFIDELERTKAVNNG